MNIGIEPNRTERQRAVLIFLNNAAMVVSLPLLLIAAALKILSDIFYFVPKHAAAQVYALRVETMIESFAKSCGVTSDQFLAAVRAANKPATDANNPADN